MSSLKAVLEPFRLRAHLIPFLFKELKSEEFVAMPNLQGKVVKLHKTSSLSRTINLVHRLYEPKSQLYDYRIHFNIKMGKGGKKYESSLYKAKGSGFELLSFTATDNNYINGFFEDIFRASLVFYVNGSRQFTTNGITSVINDFIDDYDLLEVGFDAEALRIMYYRERGKSGKLTRFQNQMSNQVYNY